MPHITYISITNPSSLALGPSFHRGFLLYSVEAYRTMMLIGRLADGLGISGFTSPAYIEYGIVIPIYKKGW